MKKLMTLAILTIFASSSFAQLESGDVGVFFDPAASTTSAAPPAFTTTNSMYVATGGLDMAGFEAGVNIDPNIIVFASTMTTGPGPINVGSAPGNWIVGLGACVPAAPVMNLVTFTYGVFVINLSDMLICLGPSTPSSFAPAAPGYLDCNDALFTFGIAENGLGSYPDGCGVLYPSFEPPVATEQASWGAVKAQY